MESVKSFLEAADSGHYTITCQQGPYIYINRNLILQFAKKRNESLLMIDSDIVFKLEDVRKMWRHLQVFDIVSGLYCLGNPPYPPCVLKRTENDYEFCEPPKSMGMIDACGGGFLGISEKAVKKLPDNAFDNVWENGVPHGEDISFCHRAKQLGFRIWLDPSISVGQIRSNAIYPQANA